MSNIKGTPRTYFMKYKFIVEVDGIDSAAFSKCSELSVEVAKVEHYEGGTLIPYKSPGRLTFSDVTLERGGTKNKDFYDWLSDVANTASGLGLIEPQYKRNLDIVQLDRDGSELRRWTVYNAWPVKFVAGEWDNNTDENIIESLTLTFDFFELTK